MDWRNGSAVKSTHCFCRGPGFGSQHPDQAVHNSSQLQLQGDPVPLSYAGVHLCPPHRCTHRHKIKTLPNKNYTYLFILHEGVWRPEDKFQESIFLLPGTRTELISLVGRWLYLLNIVPSPTISGFEAALQREVCRVHIGVRFSGFECVARVMDIFTNSRPLAVPPHPLSCWHPHLTFSQPCGFGNSRNIT